jgi:endonuclease YncB( thermonuclease family)
MRSRNLFFPIWLLVFVCVVLSTSPGFAATATVRDGNTIQLGEVSYRLDGIDAPEFDQICIDDQADPWSCGVDAREQLTRLIGGRSVHCDDLGPDKTYRKRHIGLCTVEGETESLNQQLVRAGFALDFEPSAKGRFLGDEGAAKDGRLGLWRGCFVAGQEFRLGKKARAAPTGTGKYARRCSPTISRCRPVAASRPNSRCAPASPAMSASIICKPAQATRRSHSRTAGSAPKTTLRRQASAGPLIAGPRPNSRAQGGLAKA